MLQYSGWPWSEPHLQGRAGHGPRYLGEVLPKSCLLGSAANTCEYFHTWQFFFLVTVTKEPEIF